MRSLVEKSVRAAGAAAPLIGFAAATVWAGEAGGAAHAPVFPSMLRLFGALVVVIGLIYGSILVIRRLAVRRSPGRLHLFKVLEVLPLGAKTRLVAVKFGARVIVVGAGDDRVEALAEVPAAELGDAAALEAESPALPFKDRLLELVRK